MKTTDWKGIAELVGIGAIVLSLIFVGMQLRQDQNLARSELASGTFSFMLSIEELKTDPEVAATFSKMLDAPEMLTNEEMTQLDGLLYQVGVLFEREWYLQERGIFPENRNVIRDLAPFYFGNAYAQSWWRTNSSRLSPDFVAQRGRDIENIPQNTTRLFYEKTAQGL